MEDRRTSSRGKSPRHGQLRTPPCVAARRPKNRRHRDARRVSGGGRRGRGRMSSIGPHAVDFGGHSRRRSPHRAARGGRDRRQRHRAPRRDASASESKVLPGSVVTKSVPPMAIVEGNPARIIGFRETAENNACGLVRPDSVQPAVRPSSVRGVTLARFSDGARPARQSLGRRVRTRDPLQAEAVFRDLRRAERGDARRARPFALRTVFSGGQGKRPCQWRTMAKARGIRARSTQRRASICPRWCGEFNTSTRPTPC